MIYRIRKAVPIQPGIIRTYIDQLEIDEKTGHDILTGEYEIAIPITELCNNISNAYEMINKEAAIEYIKNKLQCLIRLQELAYELDDLSWRA